MTTGCPDCDKTLSKFPYELCPKHKLEQLKYRVEIAKNNYEAERKKQDEHSPNQTVDNA